MKPILHAIHAGTLAVLLASPAMAEEATQPSRLICIDTTRIDHTEVPDAQTILFYMQDGKIWKNTLRQPCPALRFHGFIYSSTPPNQICSNMQTIRIMDTGEFCSLGKFEPYTPPPKPKPQDNGH